jgi:hypothetical protein
VAMKLEKRGVCPLEETSRYGQILAEQATTLSFSTHEKKDQSVRLVFPHGTASL